MHTSGQLAFVQHFEMALTLDAVDKALNSVSQRCAVDEEIDHTFDAGGMSTNNIEVNKWFGVVILKLIGSVHHHDAQTISNSKWYAFTI